MASRSRSYQRRQERRATIGRKEAGFSASDALEIADDLDAQTMSAGDAILADGAWQCRHGAPAALKAIDGDATSFHCAVKER